MIKQKILLSLIAVFFILSSVAQAQESKDKRSAFVQTVDILLEQIEIQTEDRNQLLKKLKTLTTQLKAIELSNLDNLLTIARPSAVGRESLLTAEKLIDKPNKFTVKTNLIEFLHRVIENDQQLYDEYLKQKSEIQFQLEKQVAKIRAEQTLLAAVRRDLEKVKFYPLKKERAKFFLSSVSQVLDGLSKIK